MATNTELTARYNKLATTLGKPTVAPWKGKKEVIEARIAEMEVRIAEMEAQAKPKKVPRRERKTPVEKVDNELQCFLEEALKKGATPSEAIRQMIETFPRATRILVKHSAKAVGINPFTARNLFDRIRRTK